MWQSSNPVLNNDDAFQEFYGDRLTTRPATTTVQGVVSKTCILLSIAVAAGTFGYWFVTRQAASMSIVWISCLASMGIVFGAYFILARKPALAKFLAPIYAVAEGVFLGALSGMLDRWLQERGVAIAGGVALQAFAITVAVTLAMLGLYVTRIIKPSRMLFSILSVATVGIMFTYLISWPLGLIFNIDLPFIGLTSAFGQGWTPLIGIGINLLILGVASFWLIIDFGMIEERVRSGAHRDMEWFCGFALLVTLAWIYYEAVKLSFRLAILLSGRD